MAQEVEWTKAAKRAQTIWERSNQCDIHPYLEKKGVASYGLRQSISDTFGAKQDCLIVPGYNRNLNIQTIQYISADGDKRYLRGAKAKGAFFMV